MLELRPNCEACDRDLPPDSPDARICTYECTFCADCVATLVHDPASTERRHLRWEREEVARFAAELRDVPPAAR